MCRGHREFVETTLKMACNKIFLNATFKSFKDFKEALEAWSKENNVVFIKKSTKSVNWANNRLKPGLTPFEKQLVYKNAQYECKFGTIRESESTGIRPILK